MEQSRQVFSHIRTYFKWYVLLAFALLSIILWSVIYHEDRRGLLTFAVLDVGQGDALYIESPTGTQVVVDGGPDKSLMREIRAMLPWYDRHIDMLVVTNPDQDHYAGFIPLLEQYSTDVVLEAGTIGSSPMYPVLKKSFADKKIPEIIARRGQRVDLGGGAYLQILFPDRDVSGVSSNDGSIIMKLVYGDTSVILQGDSTAKIEQYLVSLDAGVGDLKSTILKAGHHGSRTSTTEEYVTAVSPRWIVASSGADNSYGHPHAETIATAKEANVPFYDTCNNGRLTFISDGKTFTLKNKKVVEATVGCKTK